MTTKNLFQTFLTSTLALTLVNCSSYQSASGRKMASTDGTNVSSIHPAGVTAIDHSNQSTNSSVTAPANSSASQPGSAPASVSVSNQSRAIFRGLQLSNGSYVYSTSEAALAFSNSEGRAFSLFLEASSSRSALYLCHTAAFGGEDFLSLDSGCEGQTRVQFLGYSEQVNKPGVADLTLIRCLHPLRGHIIVANTDIGDCLESGYKLEGSLGWIPAPGSNLNRVSKLSVFRGYLPQSSSHSYNLTALDLSQQGFRNEGLVFKLFAYGSGHDVSLYLCRTVVFGPETDFISADAQCEGQRTIRSLGYADNRKLRAGEIPLIRCIGAVGHLIVAGSSQECTDAGMNVESTIGWIDPL